MKKCITWQRARSENQIEQRIDAILEAAADLFNDYRLDQITFAMIGKKAKFTRSNLYRYFSTKEEIYLQLLSYDIHQWCARAVLLVQSSSVNSKNFVSQWVTLLLEYDRLLMLFSVLYTVIEENVSDEKLKEFKLSINNDIENIAHALIEKKLFNRDTGVHQFVLTQTSLVSGMYALVNIPDRQKKIMDELGLEYNEDSSMETLLSGVQALYHAFSK